MMTVSEIAAVILCAGLAAQGCDGTPAPAPAPPPASAPAVPLYVPPPPDGCTRTGSLEALEADLTCVVARGNDESAMRESMKHLTFDLRADSPVITAGGTTILRLTITNGGTSEVPVMFLTQPPSSAARPDWSRLAGVPQPLPTASGLIAPESFRLVMPVRTLDANDHVVDGLPVTPSTAAPSLRSLRVRLRPGGKLTQNFTWWALRIPTPGPITRDDAGHRFVPKTAPVPLPPGPYTINIELPLGGIVPPESTVSVRVRVDKPDTTQ
jgi:hypothetical protein